MIKKLPVEPIDYLGINPKNINHQIALLKEGIRTLRTMQTEEHKGITPKMYKRAYDIFQGMIQSLRLLKKYELARCSGEPRKKVKQGILLHNQSVKN